MSIFSAIAAFKGAFLGALLANKFSNRESEYAAPRQPECGGGGSYRPRPEIYQANLAQGCPPKPHHGAPHRTELHAHPVHEHQVHHRPMHSLFTLSR